MDTKTILSYASQVKYASIEVEDGLSAVIFKVFHNGKLITGEQVSDCVYKMLQQDIHDKVKLTLGNRSIQ